MSPPLKNEAPPLKSKAPRKLFLEKTKKNLETAINTCVSLIKHWKKMVEIPQKRDFLKKVRFSHLEHSKFRKKRETVCLLENIILLD